VFLKQGLLSLGTVATAALVFFLIQGSAVTIAVAFGVAALFLPVLWLGVSALRPALPDRKCPQCGAEKLRLLRKGVREGVRCEACRFEDPELYVAYLIDVDDAL
jgi:hypothetical protein